MRYERGDKVYWWSTLDTRRGKAVFVRYDKDFPDEDAILAIKIGNFIQPFRWPLRLIHKVED